MNPDLKAIWDNVVKAKNSPEDAKNPLTSSDIDAYIKDESKGKYSLKDITDTSLRNLGRSFAEGATSNFLPALASGEAPQSAYDIAGSTMDAMPGFSGAGKAGALAAHLIGKVSGFLGGNEQTGQSIALKNKLFQEAHPAADFLANGAGMVGASLLAPEVGAEEGGARLGAKMLNTGAKTAAQGTAATVGSESMNPNGVSGGDVALGAGASGLLGAGLAAGGHALDFVRNPETRSNSFIGKLLDEIGYNKLKAKNADFAAGNRGGDVRLADLDPRLGAAADFVANKSPDVNMAMDKATLAREQGKPGRMQNDLGELFSADPSVPPDPNAELPFAGGRQQYRPFVPGTGKIGADEAALRTWAKGPEGYGGLPETPANTTFASPEPSAEAKAAQATYESAKAVVGDNPSPAVQKSLDAMKAKADALMPQLNPTEQIFAQYLQKPTVQKVLGEATQMGLNGVPVSPAEAATTSKLVHMNSRLGDLAGQAFDRGASGLGNSIKEAQGELKDHLIENLPGFSDVNSKYAAKMGGIEATEAGVDAWTDPESRGIKQVMAKMSDTDKQNYRYGMASELTQKLRGQNGVAMARQLQTPGSALQDKLQTMFGSKDVFDQFMKRADLEYTMSQLRRATGNSTTVLRGNAQGGINPMQMGLQAMSTNVASAPHLAQSAIIRASARMAKASVLRAESEQAGRALMTRGTPAIDDLLAKFQGRANVPTAPPVAAPLAPVIGANLPRLLNPQQQ
jgi:hypothetical protein